MVSSLVLPVSPCLGYHSSWIIAHACCNEVDVPHLSASRARNPSRGGHRNPVGWVSDHFDHSHSALTGPHPRRSNTSRGSTELPSIGPPILNHLHLRSDHSTIFTSPRTVDKMGGNNEQTYISAFSTAIRSHRS